MNFGKATARFSSIHLGVIEVVRMANEALNRVLAVAFMSQCIPHACQIKQKLGFVCLLLPLFLFSTLPSETRLNDKRAKKLPWEGSRVWFYYGSVRAQKIYWRRGEGET